MRTAVVNRTARGESHWLFKERKSPASSGQSFISDRNKPGAVIGCRFLTKLEGVSIFRRSGPQTYFRRDFVSLSSRRKCKIEGPGRPRVIALTHRYLHSASSLLPQGHHGEHSRSLARMYPLFAGFGLMLFWFNLFVFGDGAGGPPGCFFFIATFFHFFLRFARPPMCQWRIGHPADFATTWQGRVNLPGSNK